MALYLHNPPKRRKGKRTMKRKTTRRKTTRRRTTARRATTRRKSNPPRRRRRTTAAAKKFFGVAIPSAKSLGAGALGIAAVNVATPMVAARFPQLPTTGPAGLLVKAGVAVGVGKLASAVVSPSFGKDVTFGGLVSVASEALQSLVLPSVGLGAYMPQPSGLGAYVVEELPASSPEAIPAIVPTRLSASQRFSA